MNGTTLRIATAAACIAALAAPGSALAAKKHHRKVHRSSAPALTVVVPHKYDAGGDGAGALPITSTTKINLFDTLQAATTLGNQALGQLGLPPLPTP